MAAPSVATANWMLFTASGPAQASAPKGCRNLNECREIGEARLEASEKEKGPVVALSNGVRYREERAGTGPVVGPKDVVDITYEVRKTNGDYIYSLGRGRPDMQKDDFGETYRVRMGQQDVPPAVEMAMEGMRPGGIRLVEVPRKLGFEYSDWKPEPAGFAGQKRMDRFRNLLYGNGLQRGYNASIQFEVEVTKIRP